ncbi:MAG: hypothetical protein AAGH64_01785 [Planctomycetota bacterium]
MRTPRLRTLAACALLALTARATLAQPTAQGTSFTYQGQLTQNGDDVASPTDLRFALWDAQIGGTKVSGPITITVTPERGVFSADLDFGVDPFTSDTALWLAIEASAAGAGVFETLGRTPLRASTYSLSTRGITVDNQGRVRIGDRGAQVTAFDVSTDNTQNTVAAAVFNDGAADPSLPTTAFGAVADDGTAIEAIATQMNPTPLGLFPTGVLAIADATGFPNDAVGVLATANGSPGTGIGVIGEGGFFSVFANGDFGAAGVKNFIIDHPLDPANLFLRHYSAEAPEPLNIYTGNATLDASGNATVTLPDYFHTINTDVRYTLTPVGKPMPNLHIAKKVDDRAFTIAGGEPGMQVSWQITATRDDPYVKSKGHSDVLPKRPHQIGKYLQPELLGQSKALSILPTADRANLPARSERPE